MTGFTSYESTELVAVPTCRTMSWVRTSVTSASVCSGSARLGGGGAKEPDKGRARVLRMMRSSNSAPRRDHSLRPTVNLRLEQTAIAPDSRSYSVVPARCAAAHPLIRCADPDFA